MLRGLGRLVGWSGHDEQDLLQEAAERVARQRVELDHIYRAAPAAAARIRARWALEEARIAIRHEIQRGLLLHCLWRWIEVRRFHALQSANLVHCLWRWTKVRRAAARGLLLVGAERKVG